MTWLFVGLVFAAMMYAEYWATAPARRAMALRGKSLADFNFPIAEEGKPIFAIVEADEYDAEPCCPPHCCCCGPGDECCDCGETI